MRDHPLEAKKRVGTRVRQLRKRLHLSQEKLALEAGIARSFVGVIEGGKKDLRISTLVKLANALGVPVAALLKPVSPSRTRRASD